MRGSVQRSELFGVCHSWEQFWHSEVALHVDSTAPLTEQHCSKVSVICHKCKAKTSASSWCRCLVLSIQLQGDCWYLGSIWLDSCLEIGPSSLPLYRELVLGANGWKSGLSCSWPCWRQWWNLEVFTAESIRCRIGPGFSDGKCRRNVGSV